MEEVSADARLLESDFRRWSSCCRTVTRWPRDKDTVLSRRRLRWQCWGKRRFEDLRDQHIFPIIYVIFFSVRPNRPDYLDVLERVRDDLCPLWSVTFPSSEHSFPAFSGFFPELTLKSIYDLTTVPFSSQLPFFHCRLGLKFFLIFYFSEDFLQLRHLVRCSQ